jgi:hypothetical protein
MNHQRMNIGGLGMGSGLDQFWIAEYAVTL